MSDAAYDVAANGDAVVGAAFRALRGARCHVALAATVLELLRRYAAHASSPKLAVVCAYDLQHARLLQVLMTLERHEDARFFPQGVDVRSSTDGLEALGAPDVVLSCCASKRDWRADAPAAAVLVGRILDVDGAGYGMDEPEVSREDQEEDWVAALAAAASSVEDAPMRDLRTVCFRFDGRADERSSATFALTWRQFGTTQLSHWHCFAWIASITQMRRQVVQPPCTRTWQVARCLR